MEVGGGVHVGSKEAGKSNRHHFFKKRTEKERQERQHVFPSLPSFLPENGGANQACHVYSD